MDKRPFKGRGQTMSTQTADTSLRCPQCGTTNGEKFTLSMLDALLKSHAELCTTLRQVGRHLLSFEDRGGQTLDKIRTVLKRAENVRKTLAVPNEKQENMDEMLSAPAAKALEPSVDSASEVPMRKSAQGKGRVTRPRSMGILRFPAS